MFLLLLRIISLLSLATAISPTSKRHIFRHRILHALERNDELSRTPLAMHTFELPQSAKPWTYEDTVKEAVCEGGRIRLVRWHISGPGEGANTVAVEAVTYDPEYEQDTTEP